MFIGFANFYQYFIKSFSRIAVLLSLLLKKTESLDSAVKVCKTNNNKVVKVNSRDNKTFKNLFTFKKSENNKFNNSTYMPNIRTI